MHEIITIVYHIKCVRFSVCMLCDEFVIAETYTVGNKTGGPFQNVLTK